MEIHNSNMGNCRSKSASAIAEWASKGDVEARLALFWGDTSVQLPAALRRLHVYRGLRCLSALLDLRTLRLEHCPIRALPCLHTLTELRMQYCTSLRALLSLPALEVLHVESSWDMLTLPALPNLRELKLDHCWGLRKLLPLPQLQVLQLHYCPALRSLPLLLKLQELDIFCCSGLCRPLQPFPALRSFRIRACPALFKSDFVWALPREPRYLWHQPHWYHLRFAELPEVMQPELRVCTDAIQWWQRQVLVQHEGARRHVAAALPPAAMLFV